MQNKKLSRRLFLASGVALGLSLAQASKVLANEITKLILTEKEWKMKLSEEEYDVLRDEGTEKPWSSKLNEEKRKGTYVCAGCDLPLFSSEMKFDSGTGWPSFYTHIKDAVETKLDFKLIYPRTEYHCTKCGGHQGHVFKDGPKPTGERWCNNGVALKFIPQEKG